MRLPIGSDWSDYLLLAEFVICCGLVAYATGDIIVHAR